MTKTIITQAWINLRSNEPEFLAFLSVKTSTDAVSAAIARCTDENGNFQESILSTLKVEYLRFARESMGLPENAGNF